MLLALGGLVLALRLLQIQVLEHGRWALEAARLVHGGREIPYRRGRILDAEERVLARDDELRSVVLVYRDFRREHPLGQVAHARSLLEGRAVPLAEARARLRDWARELVSLTPETVRSLARLPDEPGPAVHGDAALRARRAADLSFYLRSLLGFTELGAWKPVRELAAEQPGRPFLELVALARGHGDPERVWAELDARLTRSLERLETLARWLEPGGAAGDDPASLEPLGRLIAELERVRRSIEDATAAKLFAEATGFPPGRIESETLATRFDHAWIAELLGWDRPRVAEWTRTVRRGWQLGWRDEQCLPRLLWDLVLDPATPGPAEFLDRLAVLFAPEGALGRALDEGPAPWSELARPSVFAELPELFEAEVPGEALALGENALPFQAPEVRMGGDTLALLPAGEGAESLHGKLVRALSGRRPSDVETLIALARGLVSAWERHYQDALRAALDLTLQAAAPGTRGLDGGLVLAEGGRDRAAERAEYFLKDYSMRPRPLSTAEPSYDVVYLLTRYERDFPGFQVRELHARELAVFSGDDPLPADLVVGRVSAPTIDVLERQRAPAALLRSLERDPDREQEEEEELLRLIGEVRRPDEVRGVSGIEALCDAELTGRNGYRETRGLQDVFGAGAEEIAVREPEDGQDVVLTLDVDLQRAAQRTLQHPVSVDDEKFDHAWRMNPVGAIVLLSMQGDVLAAASEPDDHSLLEPEAGGQRALVIERTLRKPTFQPPGSAFKVFVAAWALDHGLDPARTVTCAPITRGGFGYKDLRCWNPLGHGTVALEEALVRSCNAYFAWLGETLRTEEFLELSTEFGFGQPTGVRVLPDVDERPGRRGLLEDRAGLAVRGRELPDALRSMAANGLGVIEATPMQLARATLMLARGEKPALRLIRRVGERVLEPAPPERLEVSARALEFVRSAMAGVADDPQGTAHAALSRAELGLPVAVKTGSADLEDRKDEEGHTVYRKHAWVTGWVPASDPVAVFGLFVHDTTATSSHGAIYLTRDFLHQPEVLAWLDENGVDVSGVESR